MPAISSGKVLVTGANGFIAVWVVRSLLDAGFAVRGTVRAESKAAHLRGLFKSAGDRFEVVIVDDITKEGAFDAHVADVDAIAHTASPVRLNAIDPDELIRPAVQGTLSVLESARAHGSSAQRVIVLSSTAAVVRTNPDPSTTLVLDESSWNEEEVAECREKGRDARPLSKYRASKTLAERAAWDFVEKHKGVLGWDLVVLNPPYVFGPFLHEVEGPDKQGTSMQVWYDNIVKGALSKDALVNEGASYVDVRDLAQAHVLALQKSEAGGNRLIISAGAFKWQDFILAARRVVPTIPEGNTSYDPTKAVYVLRHNNAKGVATLGIRYRTLEEIAHDTVEQYRSLEWL